AGVTMSVEAPPSVSMKKKWSLLSEANARGQRVQSAKKRGTKARRHERTKWCEREEGMKCGLRTLSLIPRSPLRTFVPLCPRALFQFTIQAIVSPAIRIATLAIIQRSDDSIIGLLPRFSIRAAILSPDTRMNVLPRNRKLRPDRQHADGGAGGAEWVDRL